MTFTARTCPHCGGGPIHLGTVERAIHKKNGVITLREPASAAVCQQCGEALFDKATAEKFDLAVDHWHDGYIAQHAVT